MELAGTRVTIDRINLLRLTSRYYRYVARNASLIECVRARIYVICYDPNIVSFT